MEILPNPLFINQALFAHNIPALIIENPDAIYLNAFFRAHEFSSLFATHRHALTNPNQNVRIIRQDLTIPSWDRNYISQRLQYGLNWIVLTIQKPLLPMNNNNNNNGNTAFKHHILVELPKPLQKHQHKIIIYDWLPAIFSQSLFFNYKEHIFARFKVNHLWTERIYFFECPENVAFFFQEFLPFVDGIFDDPQGSTIEGLQNYFHDGDFNICGEAICCALLHVYFNIHIQDIQNIL